MASDGSRSRYVDPDHVFELVVNRKPRDLFDYLDSIAGASEDLQCRMINFAGMALLRPRLRSLPPLPNDDLWVLSWAKYAWVHAIKSRLCVPQMVGNPINFALNPGHYLHPLNSRSYSGRMLTTHVPGSKVLRIAAMLNQGSAPNSRIPAATFLPLQKNSNDASAVGELSLHLPGSEKITPQELMQNAEDTKGKRPASAVAQQEEKILRLNVASSFAKDGTKGAGGVLISSISTGQFICASCFPIPGTEPALAYAAACCEGIKIAQVYQPTIVVLESHLFHLLNPLLAAWIPKPEIEELKALLKPPHCIAWSIPEESNGAARQIALRGLQKGVPLIFFDAPPDWLVLS